MAYAEMMRKHDMIPASSPYRRMFLENIPCHREIRAANNAQTLKDSTSSQSKKAVLKPKKKDAA
jgi:hypothetical protein